VLQSLCRPAVSPFGKHSLIICLAKGGAFHKVLDTIIVKKSKLAQGPTHPPPLAFPKRAIGGPSLLQYTLYIYSIMLALSERPLLLSSQSCKQH